MKPATTELPIALTIAGFDPSGGAGIIADIKTFAALGCFPTAAITSLTFQNTFAVLGTSHQTAQAVRAQLLPILDDFRVACVKTGMLPTSEIITEVARLMKERDLPAPVVDPVICSTSGHQLIDEEAIDTLIKQLMPLARVVTPNIPEAERLTGQAIGDEAGMREATDLILRKGARAVLIKGGHLEKQEAGGRGRRQKEENKRAPEVMDLLNDAGRVTVFRGQRIEEVEFHGSGCTLSAAIAAGLGRDMPLEVAVGQAKRYVAEAMRQAPVIGHGARPLR